MNPLPILARPCSFVVAVAVSTNDLKAIARCLNSAHPPEFLARPADLASRDRVLNQLVGRGSVQAQLRTPEVTQAVERDYASLGKHPIGPEQIDTSSRFVGRASKRQRASRK